MARNLVFYRILAGRTVFRGIAGRAAGGYHRPDGGFIGGRETDDFCREQVSASCSRCNGSSLSMVEVSDVRSR